MPPQTPPQQPFKEQPSAFSSPTPSAGIEPQSSLKKNRRWKIFFILLALANIITIVIPWLVLFWAIRQANSGVSGTEYIGFALLPLLFAGIFFAAMNIISILVYLYKHRPKRLFILPGLIICILSLGYLTIFGLPIYRSYFELKSYRATGGQEATISKQDAISAINLCQLIELKKMQGTPPRLIVKSLGKEPPLGDVKYASNNDFDDLKKAVGTAPSSCNYDELTVLEEGKVRALLPISVERAIELINNCKNDFKGLDFYYSYTYVSGLTLGNKISKDLVENSSTGVLLAFSTTYGTPESIHVAERNIATLLPIAREAHKVCNYNFFIRSGDALHGNEKVEGGPTYQSR